MSLRDNLNMLQVMITWAANALSIAQLTVETVHQSDKYYAKNEKPSALMQAHSMLTREHRLTLGVYLRFVKEWGVPRYEEG